MNKQQEWLTNYIISNNFNIVDSDELQNKISGMTSSQIIQAMEIAKKILDSLGSTSVGRELN
jgi:hypothetical protein